MYFGEVAGIHPAGEALYSHPDGTGPFGLETKKHCRDFRQCGELK
jgi:hypothetical protein